MDLFVKYDAALTDTENLLRALKNIDPTIPLSERLVKIDAELPPMAQTKTVKERIKELTDQKTLLLARVRSILNSIKTEVEHEEDNLVKLEKKD